MLTADYNYMSSIFEEAVEFFQSLVASLDQSDVGTGWDLRRGEIVTLKPPNFVSILCYRNQQFIFRQSVLAWLV